MGNDVVDLQEPENRGKSGDERFLARVCTDQERGLIARSARPDALLWSLWAAKEAAYKAIACGVPGLSSAPRRYPVHLDNYPPVEQQTPEVRIGDFSEPPVPDVQLSAGLLTGRVGTPRGMVALRIAHTDDYVHALVRGQGDDFAGIIHRVDRIDEAGPPGDPSAFVRAQLVAEVSRRLGHPCTELTVRTDPPGSGVPRLFLGGRPLAVEISLSHDGRFAAFAFLIH